MGPVRQKRKVVNGHSFILIRQMAALVGHALAEVCTVPVILVHHVTTEICNCDIYLNAAA